MRIDRRSTRPLFARRRQRRGGCVPLLVMLGVLVGVGILSRTWLADRLRLPSQAPVSLNQAQAAFGRGDLDTTINITRQLVDAVPDDPDAVTLLARALIYRSYVDYDRAFDRQTALQVTRTALDAAADNRPILGIHAYALHANGRPREAAQMALLGIDHQPDMIPARLALALAYGDQGLFEAGLREARYAVSAAQQRYPDWLTDAYRVQALALSDLGRYDEAQAAIKEAIRGNRRLIPLHFESALYATQTGDRDSATAAHFQVIALDGDNAKAHLRLCEISSTLRETDAALGYCQQAVDLAPGWSDAWYHLGYEYFLQGDMRAAQRSLNRCSTLQVLQNVPVEDRRFACWYLQGQAAEVLNDCDSLVPLYAQFQAMAAEANLPETWTYPPEGPPMCASAPE